MSARQLQIFTGGAYVPVDDEISPQSLASPRRWRRVLVELERPLVPRYRVPPASRKSDRSVDAVRAEYLAWAKSRGLSSVAVYRGAKVQTIPGKTYHERTRYVALLDFVREHGIEPREVDPADFLGPVDLSPQCGHSHCSQNYIDSGETLCVGEPL
jgi:hypothetical protein